MARQARKSNAVPAAEWITGVASLVLVAGVLAFIAFEAVRDDGAAPDLHVELETVQPAGSGYSLTVIVRNRAGQAAADVVVEAASRDSGGGELRGDVQIDYVPGLSERRATFLFPTRPDRAGLELRIVGFRTP